MRWNDYDSRHFAWLQDRASNLYSQNGEDGVLAAIFDRIGTANKWCCECGAADGLWFSNTRQFVDQGWSAVLIEGDEKAFSRLRERYVNQYGWIKPGGGATEYLCAWLNPAGGPYFYLANTFASTREKYRLDDILSDASAPKDIDLLVIDVDGQDYYLFNSLWEHQPRVVVCEYHPDFDPMFIPELGGSGQAGDKAIIYVGDARGYMPVAKTRYNVIFVRKDLVHLLADGKTSQGVAEDSARLKVGCAMSTPRIGFLTTSDLVYQACYALGWQFSRGEGVWWHHSLTRCIESHLASGLDYIVTVDYDSLFTVQDCAKLVLHLYDNPDVDVVASIQMKREGGEPLITSDGEVTLTNVLVPMTQAHFGLTAFRRSVFERLPKPWFQEAANEKGEWGENRTDPDIHFWKQCREAGMKLMAATDVVIGHLEYVATWPDQQFRPLYQPLNDWRKSGKPAAAFQKPQLAQAAQLEMK